MVLDLFMMSGEAWNANESILYLLKYDYKGGIVEVYIFHIFLIINIVIMIL